MSFVTIEPVNLGDLLKYEAPNLYSRDPVIVAQGEVLPLGAIVGRVASSGKVKALDPSATDGSEEVAGVVIQACDATAGERSTLMLARHAIVYEGALVFRPGLTAAEKSQAIEQLKSIGILPREGA